MSLARYLWLRQEAEGFEEFMALIEIVNTYNSYAISGTAGLARGYLISWR